MARMTMESIDEKIKKAEDRVAKTGRIYNDACEELQKLRKKKGCYRKRGFGGCVYEE